MNVNINVNFNIYPTPPPIHGFPPSTGHEAPGNPTPTVMGEYPAPGHPGGHPGHYAGGHLHPPHYPAFYPTYTTFHSSPYNITGDYLVNIAFIQSKIDTSVPHTMPFLINLGQEPFEPLQDPYCDRARRRRRRTGDPAPVSAMMIKTTKIAKSDDDHDDDDDDDDEYRKAAYCAQVLLHGLP